ncbi:hypothetical protein OEZ86_014357 [Tetradesmus obliquus]|nr:hypothetical protein OEZ86_014357 [Tetradesmus obliquus]
MGPDKPFCGLHTRTLWWLFCFGICRYINCQPVSVQYSMVYGAALQNLNWVAGQPIRLFVQLRDAQAANISIAFDDQLHVECSTDVTAPTNASFCLELPSIVPQGNGLYAVSLTVGTIWGAHLVAGDIVQIPIAATL